MKNIVKLIGLSVLSFSLLGCSALIDEKDNTFNSISPDVKVQVELNDYVSIDADIIINVDGIDDVRNIKDIDNNIFTVAELVLLLQKMYSNNQFENKHIEFKTLTLEYIEEVEHNGLYWECDYIDNSGADDRLLIEAVAK